MLHDPLTDNSNDTLAGVSCVGCALLSRCSTWCQPGVCARLDYSAGPDVGLVWGGLRRNGKAAGVLCQQLSNSSDWLGTQRPEMRSKWWPMRPTRTLPHECIVSGPALRQAAEGNQSINQATSTSLPSAFKQVRKILIASAAEQSARSRGGGRNPKPS